MLSYLAAFIAIIFFSKTRDHDKTFSLTISLTN